MNDSGIILFVREGILFKLLCTINHMFGRSTWDKMPEHIFENFQKLRG